VCFILSGAAALVYQVAWQRLLALSTGVGVYSVAAITAAFMAGLGIGSDLGGRLSSRVSSLAALRLFALVELGIAAFALISVPFFYDALYRGAPWLYATPVSAVFAHFFSLLLPTTLMGMSLPFLVRGLVVSTAQAARTIGLLYGANAFGAALGGLSTPWILMRFLGMDGAVLFGAALSALAGLGALVLSVQCGNGENAVDAVDAAADASTTPAPLRIDEPVQPLRLWLFLYAASGLMSLSLELIWFRVMDVLAKGAAFTFGTLLSIYLVGLALGTLTGARFAMRLKKPLRAFLMCQAGLVGWTLLAHILLVRLPSTLPGLAWLVSYGLRDNGVRMNPLATFDFLAVYLLVPAFLFGPSTFLMGLGFPILQRAVQDDARQAGKKVGWLQAANILGCVVGSLLTGLLLLDLLGTSGSFRLLAVGAALVVFTGARRLQQTSQLNLAALALVLLGVVFPTNEQLWIRLHGDTDPQNTFVEEDAAGVTALTPRRPTGYHLWIHGRSNSWIPFGDIHTIFGALPALVHPSPDQIAIVGLGSGDTAWAAGTREETSMVTVFEIATAQPRLLRRVEDAPRMVRLKSFLADPRMNIVRDDGRRRLESDGRTYDIIQADAIQPDGTMSGNLYSVEFYEMVAKRLRKGGIMSAWVPTNRIRASVLRAFPYAIDFGPLLLVSNEPVAIDLEAWNTRLLSPRSIDYLGMARINEIAPFMRRAQMAVRPEAGADVNRDLDPRDEFARPVAEGRGRSDASGGDRDNK
jgi:spermidine synthase